MFDRFLPCTASSASASTAPSPSTCVSAAGSQLGDGRRGKAAVRDLHLLARTAAGRLDDRVRGRRPRRASRRCDEAGTIVVPGYGGDLRTAARRGLEALRARGRARRPGRLGLHRRLRARPRRPPRRAPGDHALGLGGGAGGALPGGRGRRRGALRRRRRGDDVGRPQRRHRPRPARRPQGLRRGGRRAGRPPHGRRAPPRGRPGAVHRPAPEQRTARWRPTRRWAAERLAEPLDVAAMARHAASARGPSPAASARRPARRRCSGCSPNA